LVDDKLRAPPALPAVQFLVHSAARLPVPSAARRRSCDERLAVVIGLFERQAAQSRAYR
jgi:hypothetical protein